MRSSPQTDILEQAVKALQDLAPEVVFVGGAVIELLLTDPGSALARPTDDIDLLIQIKSRLDYYKTADRLKGLGFDQRPQGPVICRWFGHGLKLDVMPDDPAILGFSNRWYPSAIAHTQLVTLPSGAQLKAIDAPHMLATKIEAYNGRGKNDPFLSHDFEDIVILLNGRPELLTEVTQAPWELQSYLRDELTSLTKNPNLVEAIEGCLAAYQDSHFRAQAVLNKIASLASPINTP